ncbi:hypothetical protein [Thermocoleostomius sinensis]|uniref:Uncharacterized protein n=1 Tax=Thermocoleostomius sinensis A174 TaxID=2016057 RepID=A0A9E8ZPD4_9CYAN|nr:hypothetical protein [Thermocoleostomius sinensis]WAL62396.1 hypothetical protein OXH18_10520 [Thermocoleostomius sinensis A174]
MVQSELPIVVFIADKQEEIGSVVYHKIAKRSASSFEIYDGLEIDFNQ